MAVRTLTTALRNKEMRVGNWRVEAQERPGLAPGKCQPRPSHSAVSCGRQTSSVPEPLGTPDLSCNMHKALVFPSFPAGQPFGYRDFILTGTFRLDAHQALG